ncbi:hypothetical protein FHETE_6957 [Fusarium heterosporum]|uniref:Uncharacterized protein n=1 Tax=Fusarium heterosporum TaxID=42747 RepID=A0A8H5T804_FUSHE|nr:hypothetical protein FHETE_6957 [Fusarium heterosporum]
MSSLPPDPQLQSSLFLRLPREVRDAIYLEIWRSCGLRQHIIWHKDQDGDTQSHFCRWRCTTPFTVEDELQDRFHAARVYLEPTGETSFTDRPSALKLYSAWKNHWACGQRIGEVYGDDMDPGISVSSSLGPCWGSRDMDPDSKIPAVQKCLTSMYESTTFIFTDTFALNMFVGSCKVPEAYQQWTKLGTPPPAFLTHGRHLELSLDPVFPLRIPCSSSLFTPVEEERHDPLDFHGLRLDLLQNLTSLDIWIAARCTCIFINTDPNVDEENIDQSPYNIARLNVGQLKKVLSYLSVKGNITISTPLIECAEPEDGYIDHDEKYPSIHIWRRGAGDRYHPNLNPMVDVERFSSTIHIYRDRRGVGVWLDF